MGEQLTSTAKLIAVFAVMAMAFAGFAVMGVEDQEFDASTITTSSSGYSVAYKVGEKTYTVPYETATVTLADLKALGATAPEGVEFAAWSDATNLYAAGSTLIITSEEKTATLTATFKAVTYTATFLSFDGKVLDKITGVTKVVADDGVTITDAELTDLAYEAFFIDVDREGFIFAGWEVDGKTVQTEDLGMLKATKTYKATYGIDYKVTFIDGDKTYKSCVSDLTVPDVGKRTGYTFVGWFVGDKKADPYTYNYTADVTFVAKWQNNNCYVTFMAGDEKVSVVPVLYGEKVVEPKLPAGYVAWDFDFSKAITEDITVKAIPAEPAKPTGLSDPIVLSIVIIVALVALALVALVYMKVKAGEWVIGKAKKEDTQ